MEFQNGGIPYKSDSRGLYPKEIIGKMTCIKIFIATLFVVAKKMENEGMSFNWEMAEQIVIYVGDRILLCSKEQ